MKTLSAAVLAATFVAGMAFVAPAQASVLYNNAPDLTGSQNGNCPYNTACGGSTGYAAQAFTLTGTSTITSVGFNSIVLGSGAFGSLASYQFLAADGAGGLPGSLLASGGGATLTAVAGPVGTIFPTTSYSFAVAPLILGAGTYYAAIHEVTTNSSDFLSKGVATSGGAQSIDGGASWTTGYAGFQSVALSLDGTTAVPEPATMALLGTGMLGLGLVRRRVQVFENVAEVHK